MEHQRVSVRVLEERHVADAGVRRLAVEDDALLLELDPRGLDVGDAQRASPAGEGANGWSMLDGSKISSVTWPQRSSRSLSPSVSTASPSISV